MGTKNKVKAGICLFVTTFLGIIFYPYFLVTIPAGHAGVYYDRFFGGTDMETVYMEGLQFTYPWNILEIYDVRVQQKRVTTDVLSSDGLTITVETSAFYQPVTTSLPLLHRVIGPDYVDKFFVPVVNSSIREVIGKYKPEDLYSVDGITIQQEILKEAAKEIESRYIFFDSIIIHSIKLPTLINEAIESKLKNQQKSLEYEYLLEMARKEAERKRIEAEGLKVYYSILKSELNESLLRYKGITATLELAKSENAKVVIIGAGSGGMPLILGGDTFSTPKKNSRVPQRNTDK